MCHFQDKEQMHIQKDLKYPQWLGHSPYSFSSEAKIPLTSSIDEWVNMQRIPLLQTEKWVKPFLYPIQTRCLDSIWCNSFYHCST